MDTKVMEYSYELSEMGLLACSLKDSEGIEREASNVSFLSIEPLTKYKSSHYYTNPENPEKTVYFTYHFEGPWRLPNY